MTALPPLAINGKFLAAAPTGVHRVAAELAHGLARAAARRPGSLDIELWVPRDAARAATAFDLPVRVIGPFTHIAWEQCAIPFRDGERLLLNLCNIGPVLRANAMTMIHDAQVHLTPGSYSRPFRLWYKAIQPWLGRRNRRILTVSDYSRSEVARAGICPVERIDVVHNGVDHILGVASDPALVGRLGLRPGGYVVALASTQLHKNIGLLARAFADPLLAETTLVLVGAADAADFARGGIPLPPNAMLTGRISDAQLRGLYEQALCLAFPSRTEGFGLPPLEAMLTGCPAIVAPCGALPEVCGAHALYGDPDSPRQWALHISALAREPALRAEWAARGKRQAAQFTWDAAAERLLAAIAAVAGEVRRAAPDAALPGTAAST
jgi:glycosyltransferase involved in cell wall biosynthesis